MNEPIRVLQLFTILNRGGAETMIMNYYRHIDRSKVQFDFAVHRQEKGAYEDEITSLGGKIYRFLPFHPKNFIAYKKQISQFFDEHPEYQIIHGHVSHLGYFFYKEASKRGIPYIIIHSHNTGMNIDVKAPFHLLFKYLSPKFATHYFSCSKNASKWLFGKHPNKEVYLLKNAIDANLFSYQKAVSDHLKEKMNLKNKFIVGHIGRITPQKNHSFLIDIFNEIHKKNAESILVLIGDGNLKNFIEKKIKKLNLQDNVVFLGIREDIAQLLQTFDLFIFPSLFEGLPVTLIEAQAAGIKCLISDALSKEVTVVPDLVKFISLKEKPESWAQEVIKYSENDYKRNTYEEIKRSEYDILDNVKRLEQFYLNSINS
jgi:glycosyltransferase involved in cell wall biosynthesis